MGHGYRRSLLGGALAGVIVVLAVAAAMVSLPLRDGGSAESPQRALVVFECPDAAGVRVAWIVLDIDLVAGRIGEVDTSTTVTVQGTTYSRLRDAYPFGGGGGVASVYASVSGITLPGVVVQEAQWRDLLEASTTVTVTLDGPTNVFLGQRLVDFGPGDVSVVGSSAPELLAATEFMDESRAREVRAKVAEATALALRERPGTLLRLADEGRLYGDLSGEGQREFCANAQDMLPNARFVRAR